MSTDLELYRVFCEVVKYKNISKTAENMHISQSAITQSIQKLENMLGGKVFYRNKNGVELTEEGDSLYEYIKDSIETMTNAENLFSKYINLEKGKIRIGGGNSLISSLIFEPLLTFIKKYPNINISISSGITDSLIQKLANGELDIVILNLPYKNKKYSNIEIIPLKKSRYCFFASKQYLKEHPIKELKEIENHTLILPKSPSSKKKILNDYCNKENLALTANYEVSSSSIMKRLVLNDIGIGFTNIENIKEISGNIKMIQEIEFTETKEGIATLKKNMANKATLELVKEIKNYYK
ncbi:MAG: LysR family transcriptional regulator [Clostridia bacterium]|nr:LysR family transcriptional regulator [Clostridia bacterium]